ncbi:SIS domain-containing protein [Meiothermus cerbereus]|uniref:SIS domain-containing protein n=1 Tax=Meiothermus cerbereus TaxID=65552 RepID=UPI003EE8AD2F
MTDSRARKIEAALLERNAATRTFFDQEASRLAEVCRQMAERFLAGGRLLALGQKAYATDAQHVSVEFVHPVIVGKRALPALDLSMAFGSWLEVLVKPEDMVMGFAPRGGDAAVSAALRAARARGAFTFALTGNDGDYAVEVPSPHPFIHQEIVEMLYHLLWETVHVFFEHRESNYQLGESAFLYPFLSGEKQDIQAVVAEVTDSIRIKVDEDAKLRMAIVGQSAAIAGAAEAIAKRLQQGGKLILFGNGGSATDANDFALDCVEPPLGWKAVPAVSLALEPASISAIANDVGTEVVFLRQLIAQARSEDIAFAFSTSGGSKNIVMALQEARKRGMLTIALLGYDGGEVIRQNLADMTIVVRSEHIPRIQEVQASVYHIIRELLGELWR